MTDMVNVLSDGYLDKQLIKSEMQGYGEDKINIVYIDYEAPDLLSSIIAGLTGFTACLAGPGAFSYERAQIFSLLAQNTNIEDVFPKFGGGHNKVGKWSWVSAGTTIGTKASIGAMSVVLGGTSLGVSTRVGNFCWIDERVTVGTAATIEKHATLLPGCQVGTGATVKKHTEIRRILDKGAYVRDVIDTGFYGAVARLIS